MSLEQHIQTQKALDHLQESLEIFQQENTPTFHTIVRDSVLRRFRFLVDTNQKLLMKYLQEVLKFPLIEGTSPRSVFRSCQQAKLITQEELDHFITIMDDRNLSSHTYNESIAQEMVERIPEHLKLMMAVLQRLTID